MVAGRQNTCFAHYMPVVKTYPVLKGVDITAGTVEGTVAHTLPYIPKIVIPVCWVSGTIGYGHVSTAPDGTYVYIKANVVTVKMRVFCG